MFRSALLAGVAGLTLAACGGAAGTSISQVPDTEARKAAVATEIATMMTDPAMMDQMFAPEALAGAMPDLSAMCAAIPADQQAACTQRMEGSSATLQSVQTEMMDKAKAMQPQLMQDMGAIMARTYTGEELAAMHAFYKSPEGQAILQKQPQVMAEFMPAVMARMQPLQLEMVQKLSQRMTAAAAAATAPAMAPTTAPGSVVPQAAPLPPGTTVTTTVTPPAATPAPATAAPALPRPN
jgi:hypothetical protein